MGENKHGFTLVELAIVLVIIGLLVGGVLVAQDLIHAATAQRFIKQTHKFNQATLAFRLKYQCLPGDCLATKAAAMGLTPHPRYNANIGDGNDRICERPSNNDTPANMTTSTRKECANYWWHLSVTGLLDWSTSDTTGFCGAASLLKYGIATPPIPTRTINPTDNTQCAGWLIVAPGNMNIGLNPFINHQHEFLAVGTYANVNGVASGTQATGNNTVISPLMAHAIDSKIDDAYPNSGTVRAIGVYQDVSQPNTNRDLTMPYRGNPGLAVCLNNTVTPNTYNLQSSEMSCNLAVAAAF